MGDEGDRTAAPGRRQTRFVAGCGAVALAVGLVLLATARDGRSVASSLTQVLLGGGLLLIAPARTRPRLKAVVMACFVLAIALAGYGFFLTVS